MADTAQKPVYVEDEAGRVRSVSPERAETGKFSDRTIVSPETAGEVYQQEQDRDFAQEALGDVGAAGLGFANELGLGLPSVMAIKGFELAGDEGAAEAGRRLFSGAGQLTSYQGGQVAGLIAPALASGGESLLARTPAAMLGMAGSLGERLAERVLPEATGLLGSASKAAFKVAARGSTEGALLGLTNQLQQNAIRNVPLTSEAVSATMGGALFGGLAGGVIGGAGGLVSEVASRGVKFLGGTGETAVARQLRRAGLTTEEIGRISEREGGAAGWTERARRNLGVETAPGAKDSVNWGSKTADIAGKAEKDAANWQHVRDGVVKQLEREAIGFTPNVERMMTRAKTEVLAEYAGTPFYKQAAKSVEKVLGGIFNEEIRLGQRTAKEGIAIGPAPTRWGKWAKTRDLLTEQYDRVVGSVSDPDASRIFTRDKFRQVAAIIDSEMKAGMEAAEASNPALKGVAEQYASATLNKATMDELSKATSRRASAEMAASQGTWTAPDLAQAAGMTAVNHPASAIGLLAGKGLIRRVGGKIEPWLAEMAWKNGHTAHAGATTELVSGKIKNSLKGFFRTVERGSTMTYTASGAAGRSTAHRMSANAVQADIEQVRGLLSAHHRQKVQEYAEWQSNTIHPELGQQTMQTFDRAVQYTQFNIPPGKAAKAVGSLRKMPQQHGPDMHEMRFMRQMGAIKNPLSLLDEMEQGTVSRDSIQALKYVYPELHSQIVQEAAQQVYEMKAEGKFLPMDKVVSLGIVLDSPIDSILQKDVIDGIQASFPRPEQPAAPAAPPPDAAFSQQQLLTPIDQSLA